jgi:hypothetical protein
MHWINGFKIVDGPDLGFQPEETLRISLPRQVCVSVLMPLPFFHIFAILLLTNYSKYNAIQSESLAVSLNKTYKSK